MNKKLSDRFEEVKLVYHNKVKAADRPKANSPEKAYKILLDSWDMTQIHLLEEFKVLLLDNQLRLMSIAPISKGGITGTLVDPRVVFAIALKRRASRIILAHNHPSGIMEPSNADIQMTKQFAKLGKLHHIEIEDHLIISEDEYYSLSTKGHMEFY